MDIICKKEIDKFLNNKGSSITINDKRVFNTTSKCGDYTTFVRVFNEHFKQTHTYTKNNDSIVARTILKGLGQLFIGIGTNFL